MKYCLLALLILIMTIMSFKCVNIKIIHKWKHAEYAWDNQEQKKVAEDSGNYDPEMCLFHNLIKADNGKVFITTPREFGPGLELAPATLSIICNQTGESGGPLLCPDWNWHNNSWTDNDYLYYASISSKEIYKIKIKTLLKCPNKEQATNHSKLAIRLPSQADSVVSLGHILIYDDSTGLSILGTDVSSKHDRNTVLLAHEPKIIQAVSAMSVSNAFGTIDCLADRFQRYAAFTLDLTEYNAYYFVMNSSDVLEEMNSSIVKSRL